MANVQEATAVDSGHKVFAISFEPRELERIAAGEHWLTQKDEEDGPPKTTIMVMCEPNLDVAQRTMLGLIKEVASNGGYINEDTGDGEREVIID